MWKGAWGRRVLAGAAAVVVLADVGVILTHAADPARRSVQTVSAESLDSPIPAHIRRDPPVAFPATTILPQPEGNPPDGATEPLTQIGTLSIPAIGLNAPLYQGITLGTIDHGPAHWPGTAMPGQLGNVVIAGHRVTHTHPFRNIDQLKTGDTATFTTTAGTFTYTLVSEQIVDPTDVSIVHQSVAYTATMFACHPPGSAKERIVAHWQMVDPPPLPAAALAASPVTTGPN